MRDGLKKVGVESTRDNDGINMCIIITKKNGKGGVAGGKINTKKGVSESWVGERGVESRVQGPFFPRRGKK